MRGVLTYDDQIALADELMQHPIAARRMREENFRVILDEAQDTDPAQFFVLTEIARPLEATGAGWKRRPLRRGPDISAWWAIFSNRSITTAPISQNYRADSSRHSLGDGDAEELEILRHLSARSGAARFC